MIFELPDIFFGSHKKRKGITTTAGETVRIYKKGRKSLTTSGFFKKSGDIFFGATSQIKSGCILHPDSFHFVTITIPEVCVPLKFWQKIRIFSILIAQAKKIESNAFCKYLLTTSSKLFFPFFKYYVIIKLQEGGILMTVGENIQKYRKKLGMSQEELGKKLLVSRQTISLWEKNQTLPTIDNLMRLKEIFHVSIDEILNIDNKPDKANKDVHEVYRFNFTQAEIKEVFQLQNKNIYKKTVMQILLLLVFAVSVISSSASDVLSALVLGIFLTTFVFQIKQFFQYHKTCKQNVEQVCQSTYEYQLFEDYILINIYHNEDQISKHKCYLKDIEHICALGN